MMPLCPVTILGGLPVLADVWFSSGGGWQSDGDAGVDALYWRKRDGTKGAEVSTKIYDRLDKEPYWQADVTEQANDWLGCRERKERKEGTEIYEMLL